MHWLSIPEQAGLTTHRPVAAFGFESLEFPGLGAVDIFAPEHVLQLGAADLAAEAVHLVVGDGAELALEEAVRLALANENVAGIILGNECLPGEPEACPVPVSLSQLAADLDLVRAKLDAGGRRSVAVTSAMSMVAAVGAFAEAGCPSM